MYDQNDAGPNVPMLTTGVVNSPDLMEIHGTTPASHCRVASARREVVVTRSMK